MQERQRQRQPDYLVLFGSRISRDTAIYAIGTATVFPFSLITVAVYTRFLHPAEYGRLAVMFVFAALLTTLYNVGSLQGVLMWVFAGAADDVEVDAELMETATAKRKALGTGLWITCAIAVAGTLVLCMFAQPIGELMLHGPGYAPEVRWAVCSAGLGSIWRLAVNVFRFERRPIVFAVLNSMRPVFTLMCGIPFVVAGLGVRGALAGTTVGTALGLVVSLLLSRRSYAVAFVGEDARRIMSLGSRYLAVVIGLWVVHNADVLLLSRFASDGEVGVYRLASRVAAFLSYFVSAFQMAWAPLEATPLLRATYARWGRAAVRSTLIESYWVAALTLLLAMAVSADVLVKLAAPSYAAAAPLIAPIGSGFVAYGGYIVLVRAAQIERRGMVYGSTSLFAAALFIGLAVVLIPWLGGYGAALAITLAMSSGIVVFILLIRRSNEPLPFDYAAMSKTLILAAGCYAFLSQAAPRLGPWRPVAEVVAFIAYLGSLVGVGVVPREKLSAVARVGRGMLPQRRQKGDLLLRVATLPADDRWTVEALARDRIPGAQAAADANRTTSEVLAKFVQSLRALYDERRDSSLDVPIGAYLVSTDSSAERDAMAQALWRDGADPVDLHALESTLQELRAAPRDAWSRMP